MLIERSEYLEQLNAWKDDQVIKVVTGMRRAGKSTLLAQYSQQLRQSGVAEKRIISINFEESVNEPLLDWRALEAYITERLDGSEKHYIFLDEVQRVIGFERVAASLQVRGNIDLYLTGSNAFMLSTELATLLSGRYVEISILPLSFKEYSVVADDSSDDTLLAYLKRGGMPALVVGRYDDEKFRMYLDGIYNTVIINDIIERSTRPSSDQGRRRVVDVGLLKSIASFLADSISSAVSVRRITNYLSSNVRKVSPNTVSDYLEALAEAFVFYPVQTLDVMGKEILLRERKWYCVDLGLRNFMTRRSEYDLGRSLENAVYLELNRRGFEVSTAQVGDLETDFVVRKDGRYAYYQVTLNMTDERTFEREMAPLRKIQDNWPKTILTLDRYTVGEYEGIRVQHVLDWLLQR